MQMTVQCLLLLDIFINRESESFIYQYVSNHNMGPKILGATEDVRL